MKSAVIVNGDGEITMIVHPDKEDELDDPSFNPINHTQIRIEREEFSSAKTMGGLRAVLADVIAKDDPELSSKMEKPIAIDDIALPDAPAESII